MRQYVLKRPLPAKEGKENAKQRFKSPKIQRLITPARLQVRVLRTGRLEGVMVFRALDVMSGWIVITGHLWHLEFTDATLF